jgi:hypothetical protein
MRTKIIAFILLFLTAAAASYAYFSLDFWNKIQSQSDQRVVGPETGQVTPGSIRQPTSSPDSPPAADNPQPTPVKATPSLNGPIHALRVDYKDMASSRNNVITLEQKIAQAGFNLVSLGAGRAEWTYFKWAGHNDAWSDDIKATGVDFLAEDAAHFGSWAQIDAAVDVLSPLYIQKNPEAAAISAEGIPSTNLISTMQLVDGPYGKSLLEMIAAIAANYPVNSISINEMYYQHDGYGPDDRTAYVRATGRNDWPRTADGRINTADPSIGLWRSAELARFIGQAQQIAHQYGKKLLVNVALNLNNSSSPVLDDGQQLDLLQGNIDRILLWGFFNPENVPAQDMLKAAQLLSKSDFHEKFVFVIGLWNKDNQAITAGSLKSTITAIQSGGLPNIWITPATIMNDDIWNVVTSFWKEN